MGERWKERGERVRGGKIRKERRKGFFWTDKGEEKKEKEKRKRKKNPCSSS